MISSGHAACPYCGIDFNIPFGETADTLNCPACGRTVSILAHKSGRLKAVPAEASERPPSGRFQHGRSMNDAKGSGRLPAQPGSGFYNRPSAFVRPPSGAYAAQPQAPAQSHLRPKTTPMPLRKPHGKDELLLAEARALFERWGWHCQDWEGRKAFAGLAVLGHDPRQRHESINVTVFAANGILGFETVVCPLPAPPWMPLREMLNRMNTRSGGSIFLIRECGIVARGKLFQQKPPFDVLVPEQVLRLVRQLNLDRREALEFLDEESLADEAGTQQRLNEHRPPLASAHNLLSMRHLLDLAEKCDYFGIAKSGLLYLSREECELRECRVWLGLSGGVLRGWAIPGVDMEMQHPGERWSFFRKMAGLFRSAPVHLSRAQVDHLLERLNAANELPRMLSYVWNGERVLACTVFPNADRSTDPHEFRQITENLLDFADEGRVETPQVRQAV
ncbi:MAG: hypothetical protein KIS92_06530 [Planctomycetota bacterium]|nr:hypothetical protein [Planctomycetota bacterium]